MSCITTEVTPSQAFALPGIKNEMKDFNSQPQRLLSAELPTSKNYSKVKRTRTHIAAQLVQPGIHDTIFWSVDFEAVILN